MRVLGSLCAAVVVLPVTVAAQVRAENLRTFPDRPVAWQEHDDLNVNGAPEKSHLQSLKVALALRDQLSSEIDRIMSLDSRAPAWDVNAADEVPCSTWYCPRNHLHPMTPEEVVAGTGTAPPRLPLTITSGKSQGDAVGFEVLDADGRKFLVKIDRANHIGMTTGGEVIGNAVFHAAGYNVPGAHVLDLDPSDLMDPAFLRRIPYKIKLFSPTRSEYWQIFEAVARGYGLTLTEPVFDLVLGKLEKPFGLAYYQPKFICQQVVESCRSFNRPLTLTTENALAALCNLYYDIEEARGEELAEADPWPSNSAAAAE